MTAGELIITPMSKLIAVIGASGVGKTALVRALAKTYPFETAYEEHVERPFQALFKNDSRYALANQIDYLFLRAEQEKRLRALSPTQIGLIDGGLDLDFHGFTRLFHRRRLLTDLEFELCHRVYRFLRELLPQPDLIILLHADEITVAQRLSTRDRIATTWHTNVLWSAPSYFVGAATAAFAGTAITNVRAISRTARTVPAAGHAASSSAPTTTPRPTIPTAVKATKVSIRPSTSVIPRPPGGRGKTAVLVGKGRPDGLRVKRPGGVQRLRT